MTAADVEEVSSSSHNMHVSTVAFQGGPGISASVDCTQQEPWEILADSPLSYLASPLTLLGPASMYANLDACGSGISSGTPTVSGASVLHVPARVELSEEAHDSAVLTFGGRNSTNTAFADSV